MTLFEVREMVFRKGTKGCSTKTLALTTCYYIFGEWMILKEDARTRSLRDEIRLMNE